MHGTEKEMVLVLLANAPGMRQPIEVELVVAWTNSLGGGRATGERGGESHEIITGRIVMRLRHDGGRLRFS
jgi:hypothetical protein